MNSYMVIGGQWGSEGKGLFAGFIANQRQPDTVVCQFGPNAGHTWLENGKPIVFKSLPVASIRPSVKTILLGPGSVINPDILEKELRELAPLLAGKTVYVHGAAAILMPGDAAYEMGEKGTTKIASTRQGTSEAMVRKIRRSHSELPAHEMLKHLPCVVVSHSVYMRILDRSNLVQIEGSQGMDLSINGGFYPYVTSRDCTPAQVLADCGIHPSDLGMIYACIRTFPIRVGNITDEEGNMIGYSGPYYQDQKEMTWEEVGVKKELTTVTGRVRRVFSFSNIQTLKMIREVRPSLVFLNFCNYLTGEQADILAERINGIAGRPIVKWLGWGPNESDIVTLNINTAPVPPDYRE